LKDQSNPDGDIAIEYSGLRPGEKLYEELLIGNEPMPTAHSRIMRGREISLAWYDVKVLLDRIDLLCKDFDCEAVREVLMMAPLDYKPSDSLSDLVWNKTYTDMPGTSMQERMRDLQMPANEGDTSSNISNG
ncbi:polysaccharide biosynthesis protein, partial [Oleiphilus sp. HI0066]